MPKRKLPVPLRARGALRAGSGRAALPPRRRRRVCSALRPAAGSVHCSSAGPRPESRGSGSQRGTSPRSLNTAGQVRLLLIPSSSHKSTVCGRRAPAAAPPAPESPPIALPSRSRSLSLSLSFQALPEEETARRGRSSCISPPGSRRRRRRSAQNKAENSHFPHCSLPSPRRVTRLAREARLAGMKTKGGRRQQNPPTQPGAPRLLPIPGASRRTWQPAARAVFPSLSDRGGARRPRPRHWRRAAARRGYWLRRRPMGRAVSGRQRLRSYLNPARWCQRGPRGGSGGARACQAALGAARPPPPPSLRGERGGRARRTCTAGPTSWDRQRPAARPAEVPRCLSWRVRVNPGVLGALSGCAL